MYLAKHCWEIVLERRGPLQLSNIIKAHPSRLEIDYADRFSGAVRNILSKITQVLISFFPVVQPLFCNDANFKMMGKYITSGVDEFDINCPWSTLVDVVYPSFHVVDIIFP